MLSSEVGGDGEGGKVREKKKKKYERRKRRKIREEKEGVGGDLSLMTHATP